MLKTFDSLFQIGLFATWILFFWGGVQDMTHLLLLCFLQLKMTYGHDDYDNDHDHCDFDDYQCGHDRDYDRCAHEYDIFVLHA